MIMTPNPNSEPITTSQKIAEKRLSRLVGSNSGGMINGNAVRLKSTAIPSRILSGTARLPNIGAVITNDATRENARKKINAESIVTRLFQSGVFWIRDNEVVRMGCWRRRRGRASCLRSVSTAIAQAFGISRLARR